MFLHQTLVDVTDRIRARSHEADELLDELERQHLEVAQNVRALEQALGYYEAGKPDGLEVFAQAVEKFADETWAPEFDS